MATTGIKTWRVLVTFRDQRSGRLQTTGWETKAASRPTAIRRMFTIAAGTRSGRAAMRGLARIDVEEIE